MSYWSDLKDRLSSRKFWVAMLGALAPLAGDAIGNLGAVDPATLVISSAGIVISYIFGQAYVDAQKELNRGVMSKKALDLISSIKAAAKE